MKLLSCYLVTIQHTLAIAATNVRFGAMHRSTAVD
jgi:hypothetical protein